MPKITITLYKGRNADDESEELDLFSYLQNEFENAGIKCAMHEEDAEGIDLYPGCFDGLRGLGIEMTHAQALSAAHQGKCDDDVAALCRLESISQQLDAIGPDTIRDGLKEAGAWDADQLADDYENRLRAVWMAACDIKESYPSDL